MTHYNFIILMRAIPLILAVISLGMVLNQKENKKKRTYIFYWVGCASIIALWFIK